LLEKRGELVMKLSTRNVIKGKVIEVKEGAVAAKVRVDIGGGNIITSTITVDAVRDLALRAGDEVWALIKASSVMIMKE
jgi:molybdopterin-binding protein